MTLDSWIKETGAQKMYSAMIKGSSINSSSKFGDVFALPDGSQHVYTGGDIVNMETHERIKLSNDVFNRFDLSKVLIHRNLDKLIEKYKKRGV